MLLRNRASSQTGSKSASSFLLCLLTLFTFIQSVQGQSAQRWFQIEVSIFSNESFTDRDEEMWQAERLQLEYPRRLQRLGQLSDLLLTDELIANSVLADASRNLAIGEPNPESIGEDAAAQAEANRLAAISATGPMPARAEGDFRFFDFLRDPLLQLSPEDSNFQQTNRALQRSSEHRLLFHALWRQPLPDSDEAIPLYVQGGLSYGEQHELQGSITLRFNDNRDRIVIDTNLWLTEFSAVAERDGQWQLPEIPEQMKSPLDSINSAAQLLDYGINRVFHMQQSRDMRSTEFHYIDHPAMGVVILVEPYEVPAVPISELNFEGRN